MDRDTFVANVSSLMRDAADARRASEAMGCDIDCCGFVADLIDNYGDLILTTLWGSSDVPDIVWEEFWNSLINNNADLETITGFYDKWFSR